MRYNNRSGLALEALGAVIITICSWITIPTVVPFTLQTFAIVLVLETMGGKKGTWSIIIYILLGCIGIPVFAGFKGGFNVIFGPTGGYIVGFILIGIVFWAFERYKWSKILSFGLGYALCYGLGSLWFVYSYGNEIGVSSLIEAMSLCVFPFMIGDILKTAIAITLGIQIKNKIGVEKSL